MDCFHPPYLPFEEVLHLLPFQSCGLVWSLGQIGIPCSGRLLGSSIELLELASIRRLHLPDIDEMSLISRTIQKMSV
jgi:hypothetical protein